MENLVRIGETIDFDKDTENIFTLTFLPLDFFDNWERGSMLANFIADYYHNNFSGKTAHNLLSTLFNELIENAVKFSRNNSSPVEIIIKKRTGNLLTRITNSIPVHRKEPFMEICSRLYAEDLETLYLQRIEEGIQDKTASGIGLILIKKDYDTHLCFDFYKDDTQTEKVSVTIEIAIG
jgi:hypothetical protein